MAMSTSDSMTAQPSSTKCFSAWYFMADTAWLSPVFSCTYVCKGAGRGGWAGLQELQAEEVQRAMASSRGGGGWQWRGQRGTAWSLQSELSWDGMAA